VYRSREKGKNRLVMSNQVTIACVATHDFLTEIMRGKRRSKYDQKVTIHRGDVCILHVPKVGDPPFVLKIPGGVEALQYHPGNFIMSAQSYVSYAERRNPDNTVVYQDRWFIIFTNQRVMMETLQGMVKTGAEVGVAMMPLMERIVIDRAYKGKITEAEDRIWSRYAKLRELFTRPGTPGEGKAAQQAGLRLLKQLVLNGGRNE
jgi:hypothetical protein